MTVQCVRDIHISQKHKVIFALLVGTNRLWEAEAAAVPNIIHPQVESRGAGRLAPQQRWCRVKAVTAMTYQAGESYGHSFLLAVDLSDSPQFLQENALDLLPQDLLARA